MEGVSGYALCSACTYQRSFVALRNWETAMNSLRMGVCVLCIFGSTFVYAQNNASGPAPTDEGARQGLKPGDAGKSMGSATDAGAGNASGQATLMQKREKAMSPQGASGSASTGKIKQ
jgi:hypothetical protein